MNFASALTAVPRGCVFVAHSERMTPNPYPLHHLNRSDESMSQAASCKAKIGALLLLGAPLLTPEPVAAVEAKPDPVRIVALGDSLTAGFGLRPNEAFPARLQAALRAKGYAVTIANAGVSGDTSAGALARVARSVPKGTDLVIVELGANDILRGASPTSMERNLDRILSQLRAGGSEVVLAGMIAPPGMGNGFSRSFDAVYERLAQKHSATLYPFFLKGVAGRRELNLADGIHPNAAGVQRIVEGILPTMVRTLDAMQGKS